MALGLNTDKLFEVTAAGSELIHKLELTLVDASDVIIKPLQ
tara:strand:+ start:4230 stop:4352 length:123 start_codon:yes stop_codon:yes gene_type:complete